MGRTGGADESKVGENPGEGEGGALSHMDPAVTMGRRASGVASWRWIAGTRRDDEGVELAGAAR
jgi:hypothetical protein